MAEDEATAATAATKKPRPLITPEAFSGDTNINDWFDHFENVAKINEWDDAAKYMWLCV